MGEHVPLLATEGLLSHPIPSQGKALSGRHLVFPEVFWLPEVFCRKSFISDWFRAALGLQVECPCHGTAAFGVMGVQELG